MTRFKRMKVTGIEKDESGQPWIVCRPKWYQNLFRWCRVVPTVKSHRELITWLRFFPVAMGWSRADGKG